MSLYIKQLSKEDENNKTLFDFITSLPNEENGFRNPWYYVQSVTKFSDWINMMLKIAKGEYKVEGESLQHYIYWIYFKDAPIGIGKIREVTEEEKAYIGHIGYCISPEYRGNGFATEALRLLIKEAKEKKGISEVIISIAPEHMVSRRIAEKCGAKLRHTIENIVCKYYI